MGKLGQGWLVVGGGYYQSRGEKAQQQQMRSSYMVGAPFLPSMHEHIGWFEGDE